MKIKYLFLLSAFFIFSCKKKETVTSKNSGTQDSVNFQIPDSLAENSVFVKKNENGFFRIWVQSKESRGKYFYADTLNILKAEQYVFENNKFSKIKNVNLAETEWSYFDIDSANIKNQKVNGKDYFFISARTAYMGTAIPEQNVQFWMINTNNISENYDLLYSGYPSSLYESIKGDFEEDKELRKNPLIRNSLFEFAKNSKMIYQATKEEKNPGYYKNYGEKWQTDNKEDTHYGAGNVGALDTVFSTYYKENLFAISGGDPTMIENEDFKVTFYFRGDVLAYDKKKKLYFPVIVESCSGFCNKEIEFVNNHTLKITYEDNESYELDLNKIIFKK